MTAIKLRPYQQQFITDIRNEFRLGRKHVVGVAPCGAGKTIMTGWMIRQAAWKGKRSIFFVHRRELIEQTAKTFATLDIPHGIIAAGCDMNLNLPVQIASIQTLARRLKFIPAPDFLICDECHHILANTYQSILKAYPDAYLLGVTATPLRAGGVTLQDVFDSMVCAPTVRDLINIGNLTEFDYHATKPIVDVSTLHTFRGDYRKDEMEIALRNPVILGNIVNKYTECAPDTSAICYCVNVEHSREVANAFKSAGITAEQVDGETPKDRRAQIVDDFRAGNIKVLCNAELFGEGFDVPNCQTVILARPTQSLTLHVQQSMRSMRPDPNNPSKRAIIIDLVGNSQRHGRPDTPHHWSLDPNKDKGDGDAPTKECPKCSKANIPIGARFCPRCNHEFKLIEIHNQTDNTVQLETYSVKKDITNEAPLSRSIIIKPNSIEAFLNIAHRRGFKTFWAATRALESAKSYDDCLHIAEVCGYKRGWAWHQWQGISNSKKA